MTLQELHELTGKVLKERPELAEATLEDCSEQAIAGIGQYKVAIVKNVVTILNESSCLLDEEILDEGDSVWQVN